MIKKLRIKFICVIMAIVMLMLGGILGTVIHFTAKSMQAQSIDMMRRVSLSPFQQGGIGIPSNDMRLPIFKVMVNSRGDVISASGSMLDSTDVVYIGQIVDAVLSGDQETGLLREYDLRYLKTVTPAGTVLVFTDTSTESVTLNNMMLGSMAIFFVAMLIFLGISILLSHWVIKPVAVAWEQQRQFVADASHELKTPLSVIMANAELMQSEDSEEAGQGSYARNILTTTYQMRSLIENMLEMARVDNGTQKMQFSPVDFSQLVSDAALSFQLLYGEKGMELRSSVEDEIFLIGSENHLYQVLDVLLDNALKYSAQGTVSVELIPSGRSCILSVASPGEPIAKEDLKNIFKRFYRADKARTMNGSYGLGLSIAEAIVTAHKGKIWAESKGGYNTFFVQFPVDDYFRKNK